MREEETFYSFLRRTFVGFYAFFMLGVMLLVTSVVIGYVGTIAYKEITKDPKIDF